MTTFRGSTSNQPPRQVNAVVRAGTVAPGEPLLRKPVGHGPVIAAVRAWCPAPLPSAAVVVVLQVLGENTIAPGWGRSRHALRRNWSMSIHRWNAVLALALLLTGPLAAEVSDGAICMTQIN